MLLNLRSPTSCTCRPLSCTAQANATLRWVVAPLFCGVTSVLESVAVLCPTTDINEVVHLLQSTGHTAAVAMELTKALSLGLSPIHQLFALLCVVVVIYKFTNLLIEKRNLIRVFEAFPGPPAHWLFGHVFQVGYCVEGLGFNRAMVTK